MRVVLLCCLLSAVTAWCVASFTTPAAGPVSYDPVALDLEDRLASLEGRLARVRHAPQGPTLRTAEAAAPSADAGTLARRVKALEEALQGLRTAPTPQAAAPAAGLPLRSGLPDEPFQGPTTAKDRIEQRLERIRRLPGATRAAPLAALAKEAGSAGLFALQERLLREVVEAAGERSEVGAEALYTLGWARRNGGDIAGAREAWLYAVDRLPRDHWRQGYARYYAAAMGLKAGEAAAAERELQDLLRDIEADPRGVDRHGTLRKRSQALLAARDG